jgi:hypothetical protein
MVPSIAVPLVVRRCSDALLVARRAYNPANLADGRSGRLFVLANCQ